MVFEMSNKTQTLGGYNYDHLTGEFVGEGQATISPMTGLPACFTLDKPPREKKGSVRVYNKNSEKWEYVEDNRGKIAYQKNTTFPFIISTLGPVSDDLTFEPPQNEFSKWNGSSWDEDKEAELKSISSVNKYKKSMLFDEARRQMMPLQNAVKYEMANEDEIKKLEAWERYTVLLNRVDTDTSEVDWPSIPE